MYEFQVQGMTYGGCVKSVTNSIKKQGKMPAVLYADGKAAMDNARCQNRLYHYNCHKP